MGDYSREVLKILAGRVPKCHLNDIMHDFGSTNAHIAPSSHVIYARPLRAGECPSQEKPYSHSEVLHRQQGSRLKGVPPKSTDRVVSSGPRH